MVIGALAGALFAPATMVLVLLSQVVPHRLTEPGYLIPGLLLGLILPVIAGMVGGALGSLLGFVFGGVSGMMLGLCSSRTQTIFVVPWRITLVCLTTTLLLELVVLRLVDARLPPASLTMNTLWTWLTLLLPLGCAVWGSYRLRHWHAQLSRNEH